MQKLPKYNLHKNDNILHDQYYNISASLIACSTKRKKNIISKVGEKIYLNVRQNKI